MAAHATLLSAYPSSLRGLPRVKSAYSQRVQNEPAVRLSAVRRLYEVSARMGAGRSLAETLQAVVDGVVDVVLGSATAAVQ